MAKMTVQDIDLKDKKSSCACGFQCSIERRCDR